MVTKNEATLLPLLAIAWCLAGSDDLHRLRAKEKSLQSVISGKSRKGIQVGQNKWEDRACIGKVPVSTAGFVRHQEEPDSWHSAWSVYATPLVLVALIVSAYLAAKTEGNYLTIFVTLLTISLPVSGVLCCGRPLYLLSRVLGKSGAVAGWYGLKHLSGAKSMLIYDVDLFPQGTITHKGVKVYGNQTPELLVSYGASLVLRADNGLSEPFRKLLQETGGQLFNVHYFQADDSGLVGRINGVLVMVGTYNYMQLMGAMPPANAPKNGVFIALNGEIAGLFAIKYRVRAGAAEDFSRLVKERRLTLVAATKNFCVNPSFISHWFQVDVGEMVCPKLETRQKLAAPALFSHSVNCGYVMGDGIRAYGRLVACGRRVCRMGRFFTACGILLSILLFVQTVLRLAAGTAIITGPALLLMQLIFLVVIEIFTRLAVK
jgi:hypothetical protein